jgi:hypothetical protein
MKKLSLFALMVIFGTSVAMAASLAIPWFVDNAPVKNSIPGTTPGVTGVITLKSNSTDTVVCTIEYYSQEGWFLGPQAPNNTFAIAPLSSLAFRPVQADPDPTVTTDGGGNFVAMPAGQTNTANAGGQEGLQGVLVPDRPRSVNDQPIPGSDDGNGNQVVDTKKNGSITIRWNGGDTLIQGQVAYFQTAAGGVTMSYAHLLPPGT